MVFVELNSKAVDRVVAGNTRVFLTTADRKFLTLAGVNATGSVQNFELNVRGARLTGNATLWQMTGNVLDAANHVGQLPQVELHETSIGEAPTTVSVAPISIDVFRFPIAQAAP